MALFGFALLEAVVVGIACMFSSTILGIKLLPTTVLHHRHVGEIVISLLLLQDLIAVVTLLLFAGQGGESQGALATTLTVVVALPVIGAAAFAGVRFIVVPLLKRFDVFREFTFLLAVGWCLGIASLSHALYLSWEIGAFVAGVALANAPVAQYIAENLRPLRDFFLVLFFFSVGAAIDQPLLLHVWMPTLLLAVALVAVKPPVFMGLLRWQKEAPDVSREVGYRLGQGSEFSLLLVFVAGAAFLSAEAAHVVQGATVLTLLLSTYLVIFRFPTPIAVSARLRRD